MLILEPRWKSYIVATNQAIFTPEQCDHIIRMGQSGEQLDAKIGTSTQTELNDDPTKPKTTGTNDHKKRITTISWLPFNSPETQPMYVKLEQWVKNINVNHFGFDGIQVTENAQYTEYPEGAFYDWHTDNDTDMRLQPPVRNIYDTFII
jgi:hypothetical protein